MDKMTIDPVHTVYIHTYILHPQLLFRPIYTRIPGSPIVQDLAKALLFQHGPTQPFSLIVGPALALAYKPFLLKREPVWNIREQ